MSYEALPAVASGWPIPAEVVYDLAVTVEPGSLLSYDQLAEVLEIDDLSAIRGAVYGANKKLRREAHRSLGIVPRQGYRVLHANEHTSQARQHQSRARRQVGRSLEIVKATDVSQLTANERALHDSMGVLASALVNAMRHVDSRLREHSKAITTLESEAEATRERLAIVEQGLRSAGVDVPPVIIEAETDDEEAEG